MATLDEILRAQPATLPSAPPRRGNKRFDYTGWRQRHPVDMVASDPLHDQLGAEWFDPEPSPLPRVKQVVPEGMYMMGDLAKALGRTTRTVRLWVKNGVIPDAPQRTEGSTHEGGLGTTTTAKRLWPAAEINTIVAIAQEEKIGPHTPWAENNFQTRVWAEITEMRATASTTLP